MSSKMHKKELAKLARDHRVPASVTDAAIFDFLSSLDCPRSLTVWLLYVNREHQQLTALDCIPSSFFRATDFRDAYIATKFLSKANFLKLEISKEAAAMKKFFEFEELCKATNSRFRDLSLDPNYQGSNVWLLSALTRKIERILDDYTGEEFVEEANWGPGVSTLLRGEHVSAINKFHSENGITRDLYAFVGSWFSAAYPGWSDLILQKFGESRFNHQVGNRIITVPKDSKTDRVIAVEPGINLWFQKSIGNMIRKRLLRFGVDLNTQENNQFLAFRAALYGDLATVDFSSASDSISRELIREILPPKWFSLLNSCRSTFGVQSDGPIRWEKFSSMGNGFTFELESLIFFAAASVTKDYLHASGDVSVFGDDVLLPNSCFELFSSFTEFLGFKVNKQKSYSNSPFRESCGSHYYLGIDCKPVFLKERLRSIPSIFRLANAVRALAHRLHCDLFHFDACELRFKRCWLHLFLSVPPSLRLRLPYGKGDGGFISNFDESTPTRASNGIEGYYFSHLVETGVTSSSDSPAVTLARLKAPSIQEYGNNYTLRGRTRLRITRSLASQWYNLGEWA